MNKDGHTQKIFFLPFAQFIVFCGCFYQKKQNKTSQPLFFDWKKSQTHKIFWFLFPVIFWLIDAGVHFTEIGCPDASVCTVHLVRSLIPFHPTKTSEPLKTDARGNWEQTKCLHCSNTSKLSRSPALNTTSAHTHTRTHTCAMVPYAYTHPACNYPGVRPAV